MARKATGRVAISFQRFVEARSSRRRRKRASAQRAIWLFYEMPPEEGGISLKQAVYLAPVSAVTSLSAAEIGVGLGPSPRRGVGGETGRGGSRVSTFMPRIGRALPG